MSLKEKIQEDLKIALKLKRPEEVSVLRLVMASLINQEKEKIYKVNTNPDNTEKGEEELEELRQLTEEEIINIILYEVKKGKEAIDGFQKGGRTDSVEKEKRELEILYKYLPEQISKEDLRNIVKRVIEKSGAKGMKDIGLVMKEIMAQVKGKADGKIVSEMVKESLSNG